MADPKLLARHVLQELQAHPQAYLVAVAGIPGSGKSTVCLEIQKQFPDAAIVPMDGYHLPRSVLTFDQMERRGAPDTFDQAAFRADLMRLKATRAGVFPGFDHSEKDPCPGQYSISEATPLVIVEGLYVLMKLWRLESLFDLKVFIDCDLDLTTDRLAARHLAAGIVSSFEEARKRALGSDRSNAEQILADGCRERADLVLKGWDSETQK